MGAGDETHSRVAVVTGGTGGIGTAVGSRLLTDGWTVVAADLRPEPRPALAGAELLELDVSDHAAVRVAFEAIASRHGSLDLLVNNAGTTRQAPLAELSWEDWSSVVAVNLHGVFNCLQAAGRLMLAAGGGVIVNVTSVAAERGSPQRAAYSATKAAILGLTRSAAVEWASRGVRVNAIGPGYVETGIYRAAVDAGRIRESDVLARIPAGRLATLEEVADGVAFLISPAARYMAGQTLYLDGGFLADYGVPPAT
jgi:3-oxoacyl-[acyl-carrier protein] reductase